MRIPSTSSLNHTYAAVFLALAMSTTVATALAFEHIGGYIPCKLCLEQRIPYYLGVPVMALAALVSAMRLPAWLTRGLFLVGALLMAWSFSMAVNHAGVEWSWWAGPTDCAVPTGPVETDGRGVLDAIDTVIPPACDQAAGRFLGLSFAGWNAVASLLLGAAALGGALSRQLNR